jgi:hypothetical protein
VSYKFVGAPGVAFKYDGDSYVLPPAGSIELIAAKKATTARFVDHDIPLDLFPIDEFGTRTIELSSKTDTN